MVSQPELFARKFPEKNKAIDMVIFDSMHAAERFNEWETHQIAEGARRMYDYLLSVKANFS